MPWAHHGVHVLLGTGVNLPKNTATSDPTTNGLSAG
jgi:hypothetical protein